jgi:hypothetical protein
VFRAFKALWLLYVLPDLTIKNLRFADKMYLQAFYDSEEKGGLFSYTALSKWTFNGKMGILP